jgi:hypothetical protein
LGQTFSGANNDPKMGQTVSYLPVGPSKVNCGVRRWRSISAVAISNRLE